MAADEVPPELEEWAELSRRYEQAEAEENQAEMEVLYPQIEDAWESAPLRVRASVSWGMFKDALRRPTAG